MGLPLAFCQNAHDNRVQHGLKPRGTYGFTLTHGSTRAMASN